MARHQRSLPAFEGHVSPDEIPPVVQGLLDQFRRRDYGITEEVYDDCLI
jgi:hypothetical protein